jgi:hypothetical protein
MTQHVRNSSYGSDDGRQSGRHRFEQCHRHALVVRRQNEYVALRQKPLSRCAVDPGQYLHLVTERRGQLADGFEIAIAREHEAGTRAYGFGQCGERVHQVVGALLLAHAAEKQELHVAAPIAVGHFRTPAHRVWQHRHMGR